MKYVGLDLSTVSTGYSVFEDGRLIESGSIKPAEADVMTRIFEMADRIRCIILTHSPQEVIIEDTFDGMGAKRNPLTTKILNRLAGSVAYMLHAFNTEMLGSMKITFVGATVSRQSLGIMPKSTKRNIVDAVNVKFGMSLKLKDNDEADGIVLGYYGVWRDSNPQKSFDKSASDFFKSGVKTPRIKRSKRNAKGKA